MQLVEAPVEWLVFDTGLLGGCRVGQCPIGELDVRDLDQIISLLRTELPGVRCSQLKVTHPSDDDGIWFFSLPSGRNEVQIESSSGNCPFHIEHDANDSTFTVTTIPEVVSIVVELIQL